MTEKSMPKEYTKLKQAYERYVKSYLIFNKGSLVGLTSFNDFYMYQTYISRYSDPRRLAAQSGR